MSDIVMPKLSDTMTEGRLVSWKKRVGETVRRGEVLAEVETDKANMELEAFTPGVLQEIRVQPGEMVEVGTVVAVIGTPEEKGAAPPQGEQGAQPEPAAQQEAQAGKPEPVPAQKPQAPPEAGKEGAFEPATSPGAAGEAEMRQPMGKPGGEGESQAPAAPLAGAGEVQAPVQPAEGEAQPEAPAPSAGGAAPKAPGEGAPKVERAAPVVRRRARELGVDLARVKGSGPEGRVLLQDLEGHGAAPGQKEEPAQPAQAGAQPSRAGAQGARAEAQPSEAGAQGAPAAPTPKAGTAAEGGKAEEVKPMPRLRAAIAKIVSESWSTIPHFTVTMEIVMDDAESIRRQLKQSGTPATVNDLLVKGVALALQKFPQFNAALAGESIRFRSEINIGVAVGVRDGVLVPVIRGCDRLSLLEISQESRKLAERARAGSLTEQEMSGGTFSVSNMGMYGVNHFSAIIYPHQAGVLAVGAVADTVVVRGGSTAIAKIMKVTLSADHRLVDGAYAAEFLVELKRIMENPVLLLL